jgi:hypothetical protein
MKTKRLTREEAVMLFKECFESWCCDTNLMEWVWAFHSHVWLAELEDSMPAFNGPEVRRVIVDGVEYYEYEEEAGEDA